MHLSEVLHQQMLSVLKEAGIKQEQPPLSRIIIHHITNTETQDAVNPHLTGNEPRDFSAQDQIISETPFIKSFSYFLGDYYEGVGMKQAKVWHPPGYNMAVHMVIDLVDLYQ